jgi:hypothetical protein
MFSSIVNKFFGVILTSLLFPFAGATFGQSLQVAQFKNEISNERLQEKIYVHTDRSFYLCGDILWFKAYVTNAADNRPLSLSKVVYVEVLDRLNQPVLQSKIEVKDGSGNGSFYLPFSVSSGNYLVRAYTNMMKDLPAEKYFQKKITIINTSKNLDSLSIGKPINYEANFFPEGGNMVNGIQSVIGFKINDNKNKGADAEGFIVDQNKDTVARFQSFQFGMGHFSLKPENGKQYTAIINLKDGASITKRLPEAFETGYVMHVAEGGNDLEVSIEEKGIQILPDVFVVIQNNRKVNFAQSLRIENGKGFLRLKKDNLKEGISQITIFDSNKKPVCERLYFTRPKSKMEISANGQKENYKTRNKVSIDFSTKNNSQASPANLSASVYRLDDFNSTEQENIFNYLWLSSELKGNIENVDYYFGNNNAATNEALDNLLLTQGWRTFNPENNSSPFAHVPEYAGHFITGKVINEITHAPAANIPVYLSVPGRRVQLRVCNSDSNGLVHFEMKDFYGPNQIVLQTNRETDSIYHVEIFSPFSEKFTANVLPQFQIPEKLNGDLTDRNIYMNVQNSYHENELMKVEKPVVDSVPFYFQPYKTYKLSDYIRFTTMEEVLREYVLEVNVRRSGSKYRLANFNAPGFALRDVQFAEPIFTNNPLVLLDGVPVFNMNKIIAYDPLKVQKLEVVAQKYHLGTLTAEGIASFTTYKGNLEGYTLDPHDIVLDYEGLQEQRIFYSPQYATESEKSSRMPDFRELLFWAPDLKTDANGKGQLSFYTSDIPGRYLVVVQGLSANGVAGNTNFTFTVEK